MTEDWSAATADALAAAAGPWLTGAVAVVAGGGLSGPESGIGFATAWLLARNGARVAILDHDAASAERAVAAILADGGEARAFLVDLLDEAAIERALDEVVGAYGPIDVLADSLGGGGSQSILDVEGEVWDRVVDLNLRSAWLVIKHAARRMRDGGAMVFVSSTVAAERGPGMPYTVAKAGLEQLVVGAATSLAPRRIRVNCVRVGMIWGAFAARGLTPERRRQRAESVLLRQEGTVWDIAQAATFLLTPPSRWVTGQVLPVDGGGAHPPASGVAGSELASR